MQYTDYYKTQTIRSFRKTFDLPIEVFQPYYLFDVEYLCIEDVFPDGKLPAAVFLVMYLNSGQLRFPQRVEMGGYTYVSFDIINVFVEAHKYLSQWDGFRPKKKAMTYLMYDRSTDYYKIGKSVNPTSREKTLQSQRPTIDLILICPQDIEATLHKKFTCQRVRGEWFKLSADGYPYAYRGLRI